MIIDKYTKAGFEIDRAAGECWPGRQSGALLSCAGLGRRCRLGRLGRRYTGPASRLTAMRVRPR